jgi:hypothetical protein
VRVAVGRLRRGVQLGNVFCISKWSQWPRPVAVRGSFKKLSVIEALDNQVSGTRNTATQKALASVSTMPGRILTEMNSHAEFIELWPFVLDSNLVPSR